MELDLDFLDKVGDLEFLLDSCEEGDRDFVLRDKEGDLVSLLLSPFSSLGLDNDEDLDLDSDFPNFLSSCIFRSSSHFLFLNSSCFLYSL